MANLLSSFNIISWFTLSLIIIMIMTSTTHPIIIILMMLIYNVLLCINMSMWMMNFIFPIMFFLVMISGLLITFLYFSSLISNEKTLKKFPFTSILIILSMMILTTPYLNLHTNIKTNTDNTYSPNLNNIFSPSPWTEPLLLTPMSNLTLICMIYLLMVLILIIKVCNPKIKTMRKLS